MKGDSVARLHEALSAGGANGNKSRENPLPDGVLTVTPDVPEAADWRSRRSPMDIPCSSSSVLCDDEGPEPNELYGKFTWKIENFSDISKRELRSDVFEVGKYKWYILVYPQGCDVANHLSLFLCVADYDKLLPGWSHFAQFTIAVVNKDPKKSKYSDTLHRFCKKEHDWGWKKFMELNKVLDGFTVADTLVIRAQVQVIRDRPARPFRCLDPQYRRELVRVYLTNVEGICRRFLDDMREQLAMVSANADSIRSFWDNLSRERRDVLSQEKSEVILKGLVKKFFSEKEVTSTLVMDALYAGCRMVEEASSAHLASVGDPGEAPIVVLDSTAGVFRVGYDDTLTAVATVLTEQLPPYRDDDPADEFGTRASRDTVDQDEARLVELGRQAVEVFVLAHVWTAHIEVSYREAEALRLQEALLQEEELRRASAEERQAAKSAAQAEKRKAKKERKKRLKEEERKKEEEERELREAEERARREEEEKRRKEAEEKRRAEEEERRKKEEEEAAKRALERRKKEEERMKREEEERKKREEEERAARERKRQEEEEEARKERERREAEEAAAREGQSLEEARAESARLSKEAAAQRKRADDMTRVAGTLEARAGSLEREVAQLRGEVARLQQAARPVESADVAVQCELLVATPAVDLPGSPGAAGPSTTESLTAGIGQAALRGMGILEPGVNPNATPFVPTVPAGLGPQSFPGMAVANGGGLAFMPGAGGGQQMAPPTLSQMAPSVSGAMAAPIQAAAAAQARTRGGSPTPGPQGQTKTSGKRSKSGPHSRNGSIGEGRARAQTSTSGGMPSAMAGGRPGQGSMGYLSQGRTQAPAAATVGVAAAGRGAGVGAAAKRGPAPGRGGAAAPHTMPQGPQMRAPGMAPMPRVPGMMPPGAAVSGPKRAGGVGTSGSSAGYPAGQVPLPGVRGMQPPPGIPAGVFPGTPPPGQGGAAPQHADSPGMGLDDFQHMGLINDLLDF